VKCNAVYPDRSSEHFGETYYFCLLGLKSEPREQQEEEEEKRIDSAFFFFSPLFFCLLFDFKD
jgi:hypothetical protein